MKRREIFMAGATLVLSAAMSTLISFWITPPKVVQFDLKGTVNLFTAQLAQDKHLNAADAQSMTAAFSGALTTSVKQYAKAHHVVVLVAPAVMSGAPDVTPAIQALTKSNMRSA